MQRCARTHITIASMRINLMRIEINAIVENLYRKKGEKTKLAAAAAAKTKIVFIVAMQYI